MKIKTAICSRRVPAMLSPTGNAINPGDKFEYVKIVYRNYEHHLVTADGKEVPQIFFSDEIKY